MTANPERNFHVYKSSAGSGKTYTLVKEYLKIVLKEPTAVRHILAITFTNAAAAEMKNRIIEALARIASLDRQTDDAAAGENLLAALLEEWEQATNYSPGREKVIANAKIVLKQILHNYTNFSVSTIDSFIHRVVRTFAFDLKIPMNFEVEMDTASLLKRAIDRLITRVGHDQKLTDLLVSYMVSQADDELDTRIEVKMAEMAKTLTEEDGTTYLGLLADLDLDRFSHVTKHIRKQLKDFETKVQAEARSALDMMDDPTLTASAFYSGKKGLYGYFSKLAGGQIKKGIHPGAAAIKTLEEDKWFSAKCSDGQKQLILSIKPELTAQYNKIRQLAEQELDQYLCLQLVWPNLFPLAVLNEVEKMLQEIKSEQNILHISDFNKTIARIIAEEPIPFIYERLGERYRHYMIDEFQDTSGMQWQNLLPLVENGLSEGRLSLVVGDGKQAIYRFRNGDVTQFAELPGLTPGIKSIAKVQWETTLINNYREISLDTNWRSASEIVHFNNRFFLHNRQYLNEDLRKIYDKPDQHPRKDKPGGYVRVEFSNGENKHELEQDISKRVLEIIDECRQLGHPMRDITILCPSNKEGSRLAVMLMEHNIPVISKESLLLNQADEVNFMLSILRLLSNPKDTIAAVEIVGYLHKYKLVREPSSLHACIVFSGLYRNKGQSGEPTLHEGIEKIMHHNGIHFRFRSFDHHNVYDTCETILGLFFSSQSPPNPFVSFFMDAVFDYAARHVQSYDDFLEWWEEKQKNYSLIVPEGVDAVQVMTVHKSKGLQFPVVIFPFAYRAVNKSTKAGFWTEGTSAGVKDLPAVWIKYSKALEDTPFGEKFENESGMTMLDRLNATYVAFTRPAEKLFVLTKKAEKDHTDDIPGQMKCFLESEGMWNEEKTYYEFGIPETVNTRQTSAPPPDSPLQKLLSSPWSRSLRMRSHQAERSVVIGGDDPMERGNLLHRVMEHIHTHADIEEVLQKMHDLGEIDAQTRDEWAEKITQLITQPDIAPCFAPEAQIKTEPGMFDSDGSFYRPDRVVFLENQTYLVDYKTGRQYQKHKDQMNTYARILQAMGYPSIKKILLYLDEGKSKSV